MHKYRLISKKGEGTFSEAQSIKSGKHVAIKCMKNHFDSIDQVNNLREIQALRRLAGHPNIIKLSEVLYDEPTGRLALVFELMDMNLYEAIKGRRHYLPENKVKLYTYEMLKALDHMHRNGIFHRDVKPENLLLLDALRPAERRPPAGALAQRPCKLSEGDKGGLSIPLRERPPPDRKMDLFAAGCVCFEVVALFPLFPGQNENDQIQKIHNVLGTPGRELAQKFKRNASHMDFNFPEKKGTGLERLIPHADLELTELMKKLIKYDPDERILARQALKDSFFRELRDAEKEVAVAAAPLEREASRSGGQGGREPRAREAKAAVSRAGSSASDHGEGAPEQTHERSDGADAGLEERHLPSIKPERRKAGGGGGESDDHEDGNMVLPPIGGIKGKRDSKMKTGTQTFKTAANASLKNTSMSVHGSMTVHGAMNAHGSGHGSIGQGSQMVGVLSNSKGFGANPGGVTQTSFSGQNDQMSSTNPHSWGAAKVVAAMVAAARTSFDGSPDAVREEGKARLAMVEPALIELLKASPFGDPALNGDMKAMRNTGLHVDMDCSADCLPQNGKEAKRRQRSGRKSKEKATLRLTEENCECEEGHSSESCNTSVANPQGILQLGAEGAEQKQVEGKAVEDACLELEGIGVSAKTLLREVPEEADAQDISSASQQPVAARGQLNELVLQGARQPEHVLLEAVLLERLRQQSAAVGGRYSSSIGGFGISSVREFV
ncbi:unnamed protein product [Prorocentrum cordatum]|uniref:Protein kinase domain-containing protein n=1 Tax=Prorocentrum cordatum TaxID=2364126 RepID=A0ABN9TLF7_9DINO|nr:unnamed protein product [Polarella glacialis]